ncbi:vicilin-like seed storage protein At2g18540 [Vicia villosa]|uniref:vicilin-like seed storage protein At2g18540 n=1 Tax=Vicia villosa TaxID=3911 RepID=UPI00273B188B|nr:vicilin-like seed storage protein At2g18540 [Vicia villosa]
MDQRKILFDNEDGEISATNVKDGQNTPHYHLQFCTLEPNSMFLPVLLHAAMVFYVYTGSGKLTWSNEDGTGTMDIHEGDIGSLGEGFVFYIHSNLESHKKKRGYMQCLLTLMRALL